MAKGIRSYPKDQQTSVASRRMEAKTGGLGYWSAVDAQREALRRALVAKGLIKPQGAKEE